MPRKNNSRFIERHNDTENRTSSYYCCPTCEKETIHYAVLTMFIGYEIMICSECKVMTCTEKELEP